MADDQTLPLTWLLSDMRNDVGLENALRRLPARSGFVYRHYHLDHAARHARFAALRSIARAHGHRVILADRLDLAADWGADGTYGPPIRTACETMLALCTAHDRSEIEAADGAGAHGIFLSPVFPTRSHDGAATLGPERFRDLARHAHAPVIALGGMTRARAAAMGWPRWGAIDGLRFQEDS